MMTGRRRYREKKRWFRRSLLVLQVEFQTRVYIGGGDSEPVSVWRDASVEDLMTIQAVHRPLPIEGRPYG